MSPYVRRGLLALSLALLAGSRAPADDLTRCTFTFLDTSSLGGPDDHAREVVPARPDLNLWDGRRFVHPRRIDSVFVVEREEGERVQIRDRSDRRIRGWAASRDLVPFTRAELFFSAQIGADGRSAFPYLMRAVVRSHLNQSDAALADLDQAVRIDSSNVPVLDWRASVYINKGRSDPALAEIERAVRLDPADPHLLVTRALFHKKFDEKKPELALADLDQAIRLDPSDPSLYMMRSFVQHERHKYKESIGDVTRTLELDEWDPKAFLTAILMLIDAREYRGARHAMSAWLKAHPDQDLAYYRRILEAMIDSKRWMFPKAMLDLRRAIALDPGKEQAYLFRAMLRIWLGFPPWMVRQDLDAAIRANPRNAQGYMVRSLFHYNRREYRTAVADIGTAIRLDPDNARLHERRALMLATCPDAKVRDGREAVASATRACELTGWKGADHLAALAAAEAEAGDLRGAVAYQEKAIGLLAEDNFLQGEYRRMLDRYEAGKPGHRLGLLEEWGIRTAHQPAE